MRNTLSAYLAFIAILALLMLPGTLGYYPETNAPPFFKMTFIIPNSVQSRMVFSTAIATEWAKLGIDMQYQYLPFSLIEQRRSGANLGATHDEGGFDIYAERWYYSTVTPFPVEILHSSQIPPGGTNYGLVDSPELDKILDNYVGSATDAEHFYWITQFQQWFNDNMPMYVVVYPQDLVAINSKLEGYETRDGSTYQWLFYPHPEYWTIPGKDTAAFAVWQPEPPLLPQYALGYQDSDVFGPVHNRLYEYQSWADKSLIPALATDYTISNDGKTWIVNLRQGVTWHDGWPFNATDVKFTFDLVMNKDYGSLMADLLTSVTGGPDNVQITGPYQITFNLDKPNLLFKEYALSTIAIEPWHVYKDLGPEVMGVAGTHTVNTWQGSYDVKKPDGSIYKAYGPIGTGPWIAMGFDPVKRSFRYERNPNYWMETPGNIEHFYEIMIQGADSAVAALKNGEVDVLETSYGIESLVSTIDPSWGKVVISDSYKWQQLMLNMQHPVFGTGVDTPLGRQDPSRAAEAARYVRLALNVAIPRDAICEQILNGYAAPGVVPIPQTAAEYNKTVAQPYPYDIALAKQYMEKAGYVYEAEAPEAAAAPFLQVYGLYLGVAIAVIALVFAGYFVNKARTSKR